MLGSEETGELVWSVWPLAADRVRGGSALAVIAASIYAAFVLGGPAMGGFAILVLVGGLGPFFVRTRYRLSEAGVEVRSPFQRVRRPWDTFQRAFAGRKGMTLSPFAKRHPLEPYRNVQLRYGDHRDEVIAFVRRFGPEPAGEERT